MIVIDDEDEDDEKAFSWIKPRVGHKRRRPNSAALDEKACLILEDTDRRLTFLRFHLCWVESEREYDISAVYGITHWWFRRKEFYINKHSEPSDREAVRSQMRILSVISVKVFEKYGYNYLREIILRRADTRVQDLVKNRVGDLQLGIESYQTKINLERPNWDAADYYFKEDYTIVPKPRAVVYRDRNDQRKLMRLNELHKFSDGTLTRVMEKLDHMVKDFHLFEYNKGMETRKWSEDDKRRSKDFITAIEKRLQIRRIFRSLESFVGGRIRDIDYI
ncbi:hypothetical protein Tco_1194939 [Tanacetum coccineum]